MKTLSAKRSAPHSLHDDSGAGGVYLRHVGPGADAGLGITRDQRRGDGLAGRARSEGDDRRAGAAEGDTEGPRPQAGRTRLRLAGIQGRAMRLGDAVPDRAADEVAVAALEAENEQGQTRGLADG